MKWLKTLEKFKLDTTKIEDKFKKDTEKDSIISTSKEENQKEKKEISNSYVDDQGVVHIEDWDKY